MFESSPLQIFSDRDSIRNQIIEYANQYLDLQGFDFSQTSYLSYLIDVISSLTANLIYYNSSVYREFFLTRAMTKESVLNISSMLGYSPKFATPSVGKVLISMPLSFKSDVNFEIPNKFQYKAGDIIFEQIGSLDITVINPGLDNVICTIRQTLDTGGSKTVPYQLSDDKQTIYFFVDVKQEETRTFDFVIPKLNPYEFYDIQLEYTGSLSIVSVITTYSDTVTTTETWSQYDSLFLIPSDTRGYSFRSNVKGGKVFFGNGVIGNQPKEGRLCNITIGISQGSLGNVIAGSINDSQTIYVAELVAGVETSRPVKMTIVNTAPTQGGVDAPSIDEIKTFAMANVSSAKRLTSGKDYENIKSIVEGLPVQHALPILKRSDLKQNEICLFTDLIFNNYIVPMRNSTWEFETSEVTYVIYSGAEIVIDSVKYITLFDMYINTFLRDVKYYYIVDLLDVEVTTTAVYVDESVVLPIYTNFQIIRNTTNREDDIIQLSLYYQKIVDGDYSTSLTALYNVDWSGEQLTMVHFPDKNKFSVNVLVRDILSGIQIFKFKILLNGSELCDGQCSTLVKRDLTEYMDSQINIDTTNPVLKCKMIDVPVIQKDYYDSIDSNTFKLQIIQSVVSFDAVSYRMLTDFVNMKFSNTTGKMKNMLNNPTNYTVDEINPADLPSNPPHASRYLVTDKFNPWNLTPPFFAIWSNTASKWVTNNITSNSMIYDKATTKKYIFNGEVVVEPIFDIPFNIKAVVWQLENSGISSQVLVSRVKEAVISTLYGKFGYDKPIYRSEIISAIQQVYGVSHCRLLQPESDIFFTYSDRIYELFTKEQLMNYSPDLVYTDISHIDIEIR